MAAINIMSIPLIRLPDDVLSKCSLPLKPNFPAFEGKIVKLLPLDISRDAEALFAVSNGSAIELGDRSYPEYDSDELIWKYMFDYPSVNLNDFRQYLLDIEEPNKQTFVVFDKATDRQVGIINLMNNSPSHLKVELGGIWYSPIVQKTGANTETCYLLMKHAFELGYRRIE